MVQNVRWGNPFGGPREVAAETDDNVGVSSNRLRAAGARINIKRTLTWEPRQHELAKTRAATDGPRFT